MLFLYLEDLRSSRGQATEPKWERSGSCPHIFWGYIPIPSAIRLAATVWPGILCRISVEQTVAVTIAQARNATGLGLLPFPQKLGSQKRKRPLRWQLADPFNTHHELRHTVEVVLGQRGLAEYDFNWAGSWRSWWGSEGLGRV